TVRPGALRRVRCGLGRRGGPHLRAPPREAGALPDCREPASAAARRPRVAAEIGAGEMMAARIHPLMRIPVPWVFVLAYLAGVALERLLPHPVLSARVLLISHVAGAALMIGGLALAAWGLWLFHTARTTTVPGRPSSQLVTTGPYRFSRNPMYFSLA